MITTTILWIILFISIVLIVGGIYLKKKALFLVVCGGIILMVTGLITFSDPISLPTITEDYNYDNGTLQNITHVLNPTPVNSNVNNVISWVMTLLGLAAIIGSGIKLYDSKFDDREDSDDMKIMD